MSVRNLHKGERYVPMDFVFISALKKFTALLLGIISYNIACQWFIHLGTCMKGWPKDLQVDGPIHLTPAILKFHKLAHKAEKHHEFSCNLIKGMGNCDCKGSEQIWGSHNNLGNSTKMMGPGSHHDVLDDHFGFWNWLKYIGMGTTLAHQYKAAIEECNVQVEGHCGLSVNLPPDLVSKWDSTCIDWEDNRFPKSAKNLFHVEGEFLSEKEVEKELEEEEEERQWCGGIIRHGMSANKFLILGLDLEESQQKVKAVAAKYTNKMLTDNQGTILVDQRNILHTKLQVWALLCTIYMPGLIQYLLDIDESNSSSLEDADQNLEDVNLWLPSSIEVSCCVSVCIDGLVEMENRLCTAQCNDALQGIQHTLHLKLQMIQFKNKNMQGQQATMRSQSIIDGVYQRVLTFAMKYRMARTAKMELVGGGSWEDVLRVLENRDICAYTDAEHTKRRVARQGTNEDTDEPSWMAEPTAEEEINVKVEERGLHGGTQETQRTLSWIWLTLMINLYDGEETLCMQARNATALKTLITPTPNTTHTNPQVCGGF
ncbi:hypothetical protein EDD85DRAFT_962689 [Armillaria nabsnona]|nr:hypothetical protein EDD85DRAFT_962689 [Armillaria nabsnona]